MSTKPVLRFGCTDYSTDSDHATRLAKAENEMMLVVPRTGPMHRVTGVYDVFTSSGSQYVVDLAERGRCTCPDAEYHVAESDGVACKHWLRVLLLIARTAMPGRDDHVPPCVWDQSVAVVDTLATRDQMAEAVLGRSGGDLDPVFAAIEDMSTA